MAATPYKTVNWGAESITVSKLAQMSNNDQWLFENSPRLRYSANGLVRDTQIKIIAGKATYAAQQKDYVNVRVNFGSFFTAGCKPSVNAIVENPNSQYLRHLATVQPVGGAKEIDHIGFNIHVSAQESWIMNIVAGGWIHWQAVGY